MTYSTGTFIILELIFFGSVIIGSFFIWRISAADHEPGRLIKLIGFTLLSAFSLKINTIPIPAGLLVVYFIFKKARKNKSAKKYAMIVGAAIFIISIYPWQNVIEQTLYPRDEMKTYLSEKRMPDKKGFIFTVMDKKNSVIYRSYAENHERGRQIYRLLAQSQKLDHVPQSIDWTYSLHLNQDTDSERFRRLTFDITEDGRFILLTFEEKQYYFQGTEEFQRLVSEISNEIKIK